MNAQSASTSYTPILVIGESRRAAIARALRTILADVLGDWVASADVRVEVRTHAEFRAHCKERRTGRAYTMRFADSHERVCLCIVDDRLLQAALDPSARGSVSLGGLSGLAAQVQGELHETLAARVASALRATLAGPSESWSLSDFVAEEALQRWIVCSLEGAPAHVVIAMHPSAVEQLNPTKQPANRPLEPLEPLVARRAAIRADSIALEAVLGEAEIGCGDLARLAEGDVLVLDQDLTATVKLQSVDGVLVSMAQLGRSGERLALHLV